VQISHDGLALVTYSSWSINGVGVNKTAALCVLKGKTSPNGSTSKHSFLASLCLDKLENVRVGAMVLFVAFFLRQKRYSFLEVQGQRRSALLIYFGKDNPPLASGFHCSKPFFMYWS
jgi:hypothetical protein